MSFLDPELTDAFLSSFVATGSRFTPKRKVVSAKYDGVERCEVRLDDGETLFADKVLCALGRMPTPTSIVSGSTRSA